MGQDTYPKRRRNYSDLFYLQKRHCASVVLTVAQRATLHAHRPRHKYVAAFYLPFMLGYCCAHVAIHRTRYLHTYVTLFSEVPPHHPFRATLVFCSWLKRRVPIYSNTCDPQGCRKHNTEGSFPTPLQLCFRPQFPNTMLQHCMLILFHWGHLFFPKGHREEMARSSRASCRTRWCGGSSLGTPRPRAGSPAEGDESVA